MTITKKITDSANTPVRPRARPPASDCAASTRRQYAPNTARSEPADSHPKGFEKPREAIATVAAKTKQAVATEFLERNPASRTEKAAGFGPGRLLMHAL